ncbi:ATP-dependent DNA helicase, Rep family [Paramicrobacterium humi]|uniref:DNA 3'-5' helicase n=1 Tax=Paramicrobacterium humi TaxID=640635 RepID=A0A1H4T9M7_9MICO|nr:ATP-dependent helicase [Microbacterium humi]SEC53019.1 ATP-dependent DNA helicase, Rep family [Microbacterium humi]
MSDLLAGLDDDQRVVAETLRGPLCVLAGAGTGKTRAITHRIAHGVATGTYAPNRVLALTFTNRAAAELRGRLRHLGAGNVPAKTFHSAALSQLGYFWPQVVGGDMPRLIEAKARVLGHAAEKLKLKVDTAALRDLAAEIEWRKVSNRSIEQYAAAGRTPPGALTAEQAVALMSAYEDIKDERRQLDFEDVLLVCAGMLEQEPRVALQVREQYRFFVVDEYQDVSPLQQHLLDLWLGDRRELCVVGDASQTIFSFAGADSAHLLDFPQRYEGSRVVRLERNYRSESGIVATANRLMRDRPGALTLLAARGDAGAAASDPDVVQYRDDMAEARGIAQSILTRLEQGAKPEEIAILYRVNAQSAPLETALADVGISYHLRGSTRFFDRPEVKQAVLALRGASVAISGEPLFKSVSDVLRSLGWSQVPPEAQGAVRSKWESLNAIMALVDQVPVGTTFRQFTDELLERQAGQHEPTMQAVTLATLHSAKGLEWDEVYLPGLAEGLVPISYAKSFEQIDEERRLLYVGITRARTRLTLSWAEEGQRRVRERSRFLQEIGMRSPGAAGARARTGVRSATR